MTSFLTIIVAIICHRYYQDRGAGREQEESTEDADEYGDGDGDGDDDADDDDADDDDYGAMMTTMAMI